MGKSKDEECELSEETLKNIKQSLKEFKEGKVHTLEEVERKLGFKNG
ncbi:hypothetical protein HOD05_01550 [Candidatus Woesearchaeota archaeon]|jgi:hypothetical protein|nr:hypothetical protein [Candidatus Woesearchaeota archaeon]MBT4150597.1 hypothetical protein [Candidatus Woesearchaeota archaeon]MBT4151163.1 hypothetical protein [Candidatus Woesearchaeota archaeon]MBT4247617.1 hypothetical protein [Candidatus Woesearchaeota archaeon]MBT4433880.1 hypothetical protein [Candidatus Woesearchaeota archaeon]